jgi:putative transposase
MRGTPHLKGKAIKSINAKYNKGKAELARRKKSNHISSKSSKRYWRINDYFHKVSHWLIQECVRTDTGKIVVGLNPNWKQRIHIGRVNNQKFTAIPHAGLIYKIINKAERYGIEVILREESYTSKASALDLDALPHYAKTIDNPLFSGRRIKRGLYKSANGTLINADVNGSINILRKEIGDDWIIQSKSIRAAWTVPVTVQHIDQLLEGSPRAIETPSKRLH